MASLPLDPLDTEESQDDKQMDDSELVSILAQHANQAIGYQPGGQDEISSEQTMTLAYYNRVMDDVPAMEGSSSVVDGTVALVVDNAVAAVLRPFVSSDETVRFVPREEEDIEVAEQATEYVNYIFNVDNPGFLILHDWFKDGLLSKLGVVKVWWEDQPRIDAQHVPIKNELHAQMLRSDPQYMGEDGSTAMIGLVVNDGRIKVCNVPPEEFRISPLARTIDSAIYTAHVPANVIRSDLIEMGFDPEIVESLSSTNTQNEESVLAQTRYEDENFFNTNPVSAHPSQDVIALRDEYIRVDYDGDGIAELRRVMRVGDTILLNEPCPEAPFATVCPIPMPHKVYGLSLADIAVQEQRISTVLWRQTLDNLYKSNNPRPVVGEGAILADGSTEESLGDSAPGAAVMVRDASQLQWMEVPFTAEHSIPILSMVATRVEEMTGISRAGQGLDTNALKTSGQTTATEMAMIQGGKNARVEMIARIFAETGVRRLFRLILGLVTKHQEKARIIRLRNKFVPMDPRTWPEMDVSISVGLGVGDKNEQVMLADSVIQTMEVLAASPFASMISPNNAYNAIKRKFTAAGIKDIDEYLTEPPKPQPGQEPPPPPPSPEQQKVMADAAIQQAKLNNDMQLGQAKIDMQQQAQQHDQMLTQSQAMFEAQVLALKQQHASALADAKASTEAQLAQQKMGMEAQLNLHQQQLEAALTAHKQELEHKLKSDHAERMASLKSENLPTNRPGGSLAE